jgi:hypothetical protein
LVRIVTLAIGFIILPGFGSETVNFDASKPGTMPPYWTATSTHGGPAPQWEIRKDPKAPTKANVLAQVSSAGPDSEYPLAIYDRTMCGDGDLSVKFKITGGRRATAGLVWRYQDQNNYYLLDFSADENRIAIYRVQNGQTRPIPVTGVKQLGGLPGVKHEIHLNQWYVAKVTFQGDKMHVSFGNRRLFDAVDAGIHGEGKTGLWTKAGTLAEFDDYKVDRKANVTRSELFRFFRR